MCVFLSFFPNSLPPPPYHSIVARFAALRYHFIRPKLQNGKVPPLCSQRLIEPQKRPILVAVVAAGRIAALQGQVFGRNPTLESERKACLLVLFFGVFRLEKKSNSEKSRSGGGDGGDGDDRVRPLHDLVFSPMMRSLSSPFVPC